MLNRRALRRTFAVTMAVGLLPAAAVGSSRANYKISLTDRYIRMGTQGKLGTDTFRLLAAGTVDGRIGRSSVHGAFRSLGQITGAGSETDHGTGFDERGSRLFVLHIHVAIVNGQVTTSGTGKWTGGTGSYRHARGSFKISGSGPVDGVKTSHLTGSISY